MTDILRATARALRDLLHWRVLWLLMWPLVIALVLWSLLAFTYSDDLVRWLSFGLSDSTIGHWLASWIPLSAFTVALGWMLVPVLLIPLVLITTSVIIGFAVMPALVAHVAPRRYPELERRHGGTLAGSIWNAMIALLVFLVLGVITLPLWLLLPLWPLLAAVLLGYLNQRLFRYDALAEHASAAEMRTLFRRHWLELFGLGALVSLFSYVPFIGLLVPLVAGLAFIHFCLARLVELRREP